MSRLAVFFFSLLTFGSLMAQEEESSIEIRGYVKDLFSVNTTKAHDQAVYENLIHNRFDFRYYATDHLTFGVGMRNRLFYGSRIELFSDFGLSFGELLEMQRQGWLDLSFSWLDQEKVVGHTVFDRLWGEYINGPWEVRVGRQRINWGKNMVWNPNNIFNSYSYFDFDYEERPGTDAVRVQYFINYASSAEISYAPDSTWEQSTLAGYYSFNQWDYDFQLLAGKYRENWVAGLGWAGYIGNATFKGEGTLFVPHQESQDPFVAASVSGSYVFGNGINLNSEVLYNGNQEPLNLFALQSSGISADNLSPFTWSAFLSANYAFHPLWSVGNGLIYYPEPDLVFFSPSVTYSAADNLDILLLAQLFAGDISTLTGDAASPGVANYTNLYALRIKWSF